VEAAALEPDSPEMWRIVLHLASLAEREDVRRTALERLSQLDPADESVRLQRLNLALERYQTLPERMAAYETLLEEENIPRLGEVAASRLALDLALIKQRSGDADGFSRWLARALELDRANRTAAAIATGFYQANVIDPVGEAELLVNLFLADPTAIPTQVDLAQLLLGNGAYNGAYRMYALATEGLRTNHILPSTQLLADMAVAQWARGDSEAALDTIDRRQAEIDEAYRQAQGQADQRLTRADLAKIKGPLDPTLTAVAAVIKTGRGDRDAEAALDAALAAYDAGIEEMKQVDPPMAPSDIAGRHLEAAWLALWLGRDSARAMAIVAAAEQLQPLSDEARNRFEGWKALKDGQPERAIELLSPLAEKDPAARAGLALALIGAGRNKDAARELLALNQAQPGSMMGIWAANQLTGIIGQRVPLSEHADKMERLIASISHSIDRYVREGSMVVGVRVVPENPNPGPYDPIRVRIELTNNSMLPLALDAAGPLRPQILVVPRLNTATPIDQAPKAFIVDMDTRLRLAPRETASISFDLRWQNAGKLLNTIAVTGGLLKLTVQTNFIATSSGNILPGLYGVEVEAPMLRIDGVRKDDQWLEQAVAMMHDPNAAPSALVFNMALVTDEVLHAVAERNLPVERARMLESALAALPDAFARLDDASQAWFLTLTPQRLEKSALLAMARKSDSRLVKIVYLLYHLSGPDDPMIDAALRGEDETLRRLASTIKAAPPGEDNPLIPAGTGADDGAGTTPATQPQTSLPLPAPAPASAPATTAPALPPGTTIPSPTGPAAVGPG
jgi:hypothetical protein